MKRVLILLGVCALLLPAPGFVTAAASASLVTVGSPAGPTPQNHQNEPAVAMDASPPKAASKSMEPSFNEPVRMERQAAPPIPASSVAMSDAGRPKR